MFSKAFAPCAALVVVMTGTALLTGCGTSSPGPEGSKAQTMSGVSPSGYPGGQPSDPHSPALGSSSEQQHSEPGPKVGEDESKKSKPEKAAEKPAAK